MDEKFLLVTGSQPDRWADALEQALAPLGSLEITTREESPSRLGQCSYAVVVIDSSAIAEPSRLTTDLLTLYPGTRVVVATFSPTWKRALEAIQAGAMDYFTKTMVKEELRKKIEAVLKIPINGQAWAR